MIVHHYILQFTSKDHNYKPLMYFGQNHNINLVLIHVLFILPPPQKKGVNVT